MKSSIGVKIFVAVFAVLILALAIQSAVFDGTFSSFYRSAAIQDMGSRLDEAAQAFVPEGESGEDGALAKYSAESGSPVMVINERYEICDSSLMNNMSTLTLKLSDVGVIKLNVDFLNGDVATIATQLSSGRRLSIKAVRVGEAGYYDALTVANDSFSYTNRRSVRDYLVDETADKTVSGQAKVIRFRNLSGFSGESKLRAEIIYDAVKELLILKRDIPEYLEGLTNETREDTTLGPVRFIYTERDIDDTRYYFIAVQKDNALSGEDMYIKRYIALTLATLGVAMLIIALMLSRALSAPLVRLSAVTKKISSLDFSESTGIRSNDELGMLSRDIDSMSKSLSDAIDKLNEANARLEESMTSARMNEERMKTLLTNTAHEFKTPLGIISAYAEAIRLRIDPASDERSFEVIDAEIARLSGLVNDIIELSKLRGGLWKYEPGRIDISELVSDAVERFAPKLDASHMRVELDVPHVFVLADRKRIEQVTVNLMSNALKYGTGDALTIALVYDDEATVKLTMSNEGMIEAKEAERIWRRFYTGVNAREINVSSDGIGLDIAACILDMHKSSYGMKQSGGVVTFFFTLEVAR